LEQVNADDANRIQELELQIAREDLALQGLKQQMAGLESKAAEIQRKIDGAGAQWGWGLRMWSPHGRRSWLGIGVLASGATKLSSRRVHLSRYVGSERVLGQCKQFTARRFTQGPHLHAACCPVQVVTS
jgi:hypothetical protein